jgi:hypothetical protein
MCLTDSSLIRIMCLESVGAEIPVGETEADNDFGL